MLRKEYFLNDYDKVAAFVVTCNFLLVFKNKLYKKMFGNMKAVPY